MSASDGPIDTEISREQMLIVRGNVRHRLLIAMHEHQLSERLERKVGNRAAAADHAAEVSRLAQMIHAIDEADELDPHDVPLPVRLQETN